MADRSQRTNAARRLRPGPPAPPPAAVAATPWPGGDTTPVNQRLDLLDIKTGQLITQVGLGHDYATAVGWSHDRKVGRRWHLRRPAHAVRRDDAGPDRRRRRRAQRRDPVRELLPGRLDAGDRRLRRHELVECSRAGPGGCTHRRRDRRRPRMVVLLVRPRQTIRSGTPPGRGRIPAGRLVQLSRSADSLSRRRVPVGRCGHHPRTWTRYLGSRPYGRVCPR